MVSSTHGRNYEILRIHIGLYIYNKFIILGNMRIILLILILSSCSNTKLPKIKIKTKTKKPQDTLSISEQQGLKQIRFLDSLSKIGKF